MKKVMMSVLLAFLAACLFASCTGGSSKVSNPSTTVTKGSSLASASKSLSPLTPTPPVFSVKNQKISLSEFGITEISSSSFYWSPDGKYIVFMASVKESNGKFTPHVYLFTVKTKQVTKIADGVTGRNYYLQEPDWSEDDTLFTVPFYDMEKQEYPVYLYHMNEKKLEVAAPKGVDVAISPDKTKIIFVNKDGNICLFVLRDKVVTVLSENIKGYHPIWFSDNSRILFFKRTGKNPSGLEGAELENICILDTKKPNTMTYAGKESVFRDCRWLRRDTQVWIRSGWDDGDFSGCLTIDSLEYKEFGETSGISYWIRDKELFYISVDESGKYTLLSETFLPVGIYPVDKIGKGGGINHIVGLYSGKKLIYLMTDTTNKKTDVLFSELNGKKTTKLLSYNGIYQALAASDSSGTALIPDNGDHFILITP